MAQTLYTKEGRPISVPDGEVDTLIRGGKLFFAQDSTVPVIAPDGQAGTLDAASATDAIRSGTGFRTETEGEQDYRQIKTEYGSGFGDELLAGMAGAARGLSFGLSDQLLTKTGLVEAETLRGLKIANPTATGVGEIGATVGSMFLPGGGAGKAAKLLKGAGSGVRGVSKIGQGVERAVFKGLEGGMGQGIAKRALARGVSMGTAGAVEGTIYGAGQILSEDALADGNMDWGAEAILGHLGTSAAIGGGMGAILGGGLEGIIGGSRAVAGKTRDGIVGLWEKATGNKAHPKLGEALDGWLDKYAKTAAVATGQDEAVIRKMIQRGEGGSLIRKLATSGDEVRENAARQLSGFEDDLVGIFDKLADEGRGVFKLRNVQKIIGKVDTEKATMKAWDQLEQITKRVDDVIADQSSTWGSRSAWIGKNKSVQTSVKNATRRIEKIAAEGFPAPTKDAAARIFMVGDDLKRDVGKIRKALGRKKDPSFAEQQTMQDIDDIYHGLRDHLEDVTIFGGAAQAQERINAKWVNYLKSNAYRDRFHVKWQEGEGFKRAIYKTDPAKMRSFVDRVESTTNDLDYQWLNGRQKARQELLDELVDSFKLDKPLQEMAHEAQKSLNGFGKAFREVEEKVILQNQLRGLVSSGSETATLAGGLGGYALAGLPGMAIGGIIGSITNPGRTIQRLAVLERMIKNYDGQIGKSIKTYIKTISGGAKKTAKGARKAITPTSIFGLSYGEERSKKGETKVESFRKRLAELERVQTNPEAATKRIVDSTDKIAGVAPKLAQAIAVKAQQAAGYLLDKAPKDPRPPTAIAGRPWTPTDRDLQRWEKIAGAVEDPLNNFMNSMTDGTVTRDEVEAIELIHPETFQKIKTGIIDELAENPESVDFNGRIQLSIIFATPFDPSASPHHIQSIQAGILAPPQQQDQRAGGLRTSGVAKIKTEPALSPTQAIDV